MNGSILLGIWLGTQCLPEVSGRCQGKTHPCLSFGQEESRRLGAGVTQEAEMLVG